VLVLVLGVALDVLLAGGEGALVVVLGPFSVPLLPARKVAVLLVLGMVLSLFLTLGELAFVAVALVFHLASSLSLSPG
jgi:hypothetical protein